MDNREEDQELQKEEEEEGGSSSSKGSQEDPHPKTSSLTPPKVAKNLNPPLPPLSPRPSEESEFKQMRQGLYKLCDLDHLLSPSEETENIGIPADSDVNQGIPADSDVNQENVKQYESSAKESVGTRSPVGPRNSPVTSALKTVSTTNSDESLAESKTNEKDKWGLSDEERVELESPVVSGNAPVASALKTESTDNFHESPADSSGNEALCSDNQKEEQELEDDEEEGINEGPHPKTPSLSPSHHTPIHKKLSFSKESEDEQQELQLEPSEETVESKFPVGPGNPPVVTSALKTGSTNSGKSLADSDTNKRVELKSPADSPQAKRIRTEGSNPDHKSN